MTEPICTCNHRYTGRHAYCCPVVARHGWTPSLGPTAPTESNGRQAPKSSTTGASPNLTASEKASSEQGRRIADQIHKVSGAINTAAYAIGHVYGFGAVLSATSAQWAEHIRRTGEPAGGHFLIGPCAAETELCGCKEPYQCDWCAGTGWLTTHVKKVKEFIYAK